MNAAAINGAALADTITAVAWAIGAIGLAWLAVGVTYALMHQRRVSASIDSRLGHLELGVNGIDGTEDDPPLVDKVRALQKGQRDVIGTLNRICDHLGIDHHKKEAA